MHLLAGRDFNSRDTPNSPMVAIVNGSFAKRYFQGQGAVGQRYREEQGNKLGDRVEIVGMVGDAKYLDLREEFHPTVYIATSQKSDQGRNVTVELRVTGNTTTVIREAKRAADVVAPEASFQFKTLAEQVGGSIARERLLAVLSGFFGGLALLLALIGLYGVTSYNVTQRRKEIGIRMALGAQPSRVLRTVLGEVTILIGIGLALGLAATVGATHFIASFLYGVKASDPWTLSGSAVMLGLVAGLAGFLPARRASRIDPMNSLREE
jgi:ABC-type antimicrobial peptide transport system permease subunit